MSGLLARFASVAASVRPLLCASSLSIASVARRSMFTSSPALRFDAGSSLDESSKKAKAVQDSMFRDQVKGMLVKKQYCFGDFVREMRTTVDMAKNSAGIAEKVTMLFKGEPEELKQLEASLKVLELATAEERLATDIVFFNLQRKQAFVKRIADSGIAGEAAAHAEKFNDLLRQFGGMQRIHRFVHWRKERFLPVPETQEQLELMMRDQPASLDKSMRGMQRMSRRR